MPSLPDPIHHAAGAFDSLPGVGPRAALRYAFWLVTQPKEAIVQFARALESLATQVQTCAVCGQWSDSSPCPICRDPKRDATIVCVVATSQDVRAVEDTGVFRGRYHVLGGTLDPIEGRTPETLGIVKLMKRVQTSQPPIQELILALDADIPGDTTALYLKNQLANLPVKITRLARGLPTGAQLEYADATTLADALVHRSGN